VRDIFRLYLSGLSYSRIASEMERRGIKYHQHTDQWNKHMVKRILENDTYMGGGQYPQLISTDELQAVRLQRDGKATPSSRPAEIGPVREKAVCACCGAKMLRDTKAKGRPRWRCSNDGCGLTAYGEDTQVLEALDHRLRQLAAAPQLLTLPMPARRERAFHEAAYIARGPVVYCHAPAYDAVEADGETTLCAREGFAVALKKDAPIEAAEDGKTLRTRGVSAPNWA